MSSQLSITGGGGTFPFSAPSPQQRTWDMILLGKGLYGHPKIPTEAAQRHPQPHWQSITMGCCTPTGTLGCTSRGGSLNPTCTTEAPRAGRRGVRPHQHPSPSPSLLLFPLLFSKIPNQIKPTTGCGSELIFKMHNHGRASPLPWLAGNRYKQNELPSLPGLAASLSPDLNFKSWLGCSTEH